MASTPSPQEILEIAQYYYTLIRDRVTYTFSGMFSMSQWQWIRMVLVVVGYIAVRPLIVKVGSWISEKEMAKKERKENETKDKARRERRAAGKANIGANSLRTGMVIGEVVEEEHGDGLVVEGVDLGTSGKARNRKGKTGSGGTKNMQPEVSEEMQRILEEMSSDEDVEDLLTATG